MSLKEGKENKKNFTGFEVIYKNGKKIYEKNNYYSRKLKKKCATNWREIEKEKIKSLRLYWNGEIKVQIDKENNELHKEIKSENWYFSHTGYFDTSINKIKIISRNIGYKEDNLLYLFKVMEDTGEVIFKTEIIKSSL
jgi:hypothetical protein